jgi:hypothetical protein
MSPKIVCEKKWKLYPPKTASDKMLFLLPCVIVFFDILLIEILVVHDNNNSSQSVTGQVSVCAGYIIQTSHFDCVYLLILKIGPFVVAFIYHFLISIFKMCLCTHVYLRTSVFEMCLCTHVYLRISVFGFFFYYEEVCIVFFKFNIYCLLLLFCLPVMLDNVISI